MNINLPEVPLSSGPGAQSSLGTINASNYGGHAPIVGAHVYVVQAGTGGYGSVVKGLLTANSAQAAYPTTENGSWTNSSSPADALVPATDSAGNPFYGVTTDGSGNISITGDYTCTQGLPVFLIAYGGTPSFGGTGANTVAISSAAVTSTGVGGTALFTFTATTAELFYEGESITISNFTAPSTGFNISGVVANPGTVNGAVLTSTQFSIQLTGAADVLGAGTYFNYPGVTGTATATPPWNPAVVNMALLGLCPSTGNFSSGPSALQYVYMNEVSTAAVAFAFGPFMNWSATDQTGNDEFHLGTSSTNLIGLQNAAVTAADLYDIQGGNVSTASDGDGHIARTATATGVGIVPQTTLDTVGNILAACVDSANTAGSTSPQCKTLESYAADNGAYDTTSQAHWATNTAQAAFNLAHFPQGSGTGTTSGGVQTLTTGNASTASAFMSALFNLPTGNVPFLPALSTAPNDFAVQIKYPSPATNLQDAAVDANGKLWVTTYATPYTYLFDPTTATYTQYANSLQLVGGNYIAVDNAGNVFETSELGLGVDEFLNNAGTVATAATNLDILKAPLTSFDLALDPANNLIVANTSIAQVTSTLFESPRTLLPYWTDLAAELEITPSQVCVGNIHHVALANFNNGSAGNAYSDAIWSTNENPATSPIPLPAIGQAPAVCLFAHDTGALLYAWTGSGVNQPEIIAVDNLGAAWVADYGLNKLSKLVYNVANGTVAIKTAVGGSLASPFGVAVDGAGQVWVSNRSSGSGGRSLSVYQNAATAISPTYYKGPGYLTDPCNISIDKSGNVWVVDDAGGAMVEYVGAAAPTVTPLAVAVTNNSLGAKP